MATTTVNIAFQKDLLREIDRMARAESRSRSEFLREAARAYILRKQRWTDLFAAGRRIAEQNQITPQDLHTQIQAHRTEKNPRR